jgi:signal transduction histidine kinase
VTRRRPWSLRTRYTVGAAVAITVLVGLFALGTVLEVGIHLVEVARGNAAATAQQVLAVIAHDAATRGPRRIARLTAALANYLGNFTNPEDPRVWVVGSGLRLASPNVSFRLPRRLSPRLIGDRAFWMAVTHVPGQPLTVVVAYPVHLGLVGHLAEVLAIGVVIASVVAAVVGRWTTRRVLAPVDQMTAAATAMLQEGAPLVLPDLPGAADEFTRLADVLRRLVANLEERRQRERRLLAEAAHQLRTPFAVIQGNLHLAATWRERDAAVADDSLAAAERHVERMRNLIDDLLALEMAQGAGESPLTTVNLVETVREMAADAAALSPAIRLIGPDPHPSAVWVRADVAGLQRALWAVVENALRYCPAGATVKLTVAQEGVHGLAVVEDSGPGIPPEEREAVWERFYRGEAARGQPGSGLGLPIARALIQQQQGEVALDASPDLGGTRVTFRLRLASTVPQPLGAGLPPSPPA